MANRVKIETCMIFPWTFVAMQNYTGVNKSWLFYCERFGVKTMTFEVAGTFIGEKHISIF